MIGIFTHTRWQSPWFIQCVASVRAALPPDGEHVVREMREDYQRERFSALREFEYCGFVDDDDLVYPEAISACAEALETTGAGVAFTMQDLIDADGNKISVTRPAKDTLDIAMDPQAIHHFALIRRSAVDDAVLRAAVDLDIGIDWLMKAYAGLRHGAVLVPMVGYGWRQHDGMDSKARDAHFRENLPALRQRTLSWMRDITRVPIHTLQ